MERGRGHDTNEAEAEAEARYSGLEAEALTSLEAIVTLCDPMASVTPIALRWSSIKSSIQLNLTLTTTRRRRRNFTN